jgi:phenylacetate-CoA ligase
MGGYTDHSNLETTGAAVVPFGVRNSRQLVRLIQEAGVNAISSTPSYPNYLEGIVREELGIEPIELGVKLGLFGGEPALENPNFRKHVEETWGMRASNANYGMSDVLCNFASVCDDRYELHYLGQGAVLAQLIEPMTGEDIPIEEGAKGELVLTNLEREAQPLVRYRTRDMFEILGTGACACGRTGFRFRVIGRSDDMLHVKGINVFPSGIADVLNAFIPDVTGEFQVVLMHPGPYDHLDIKVEHGEDIRPEEMEAIREKIEIKIRDILTFNANVEWISPNSVPKTEMGKAIRVVRKF